MRLFFDAFDPNRFFDVFSDSYIWQASDVVRLVITSRAETPRARSFTTGSGNDSLSYTGSWAYTSAQLTFSTGAGDDRLLIGAGHAQIIGSAIIDAGTGNDHVTIAHIQGAIGAGGGVDGGDGDDRIEVTTKNGIGLFGNTRFYFRGGAGDDSFSFGGIQYNLLGSSINKVDGGSGFDTLYWNASYDLNVGTDQTGADRLGAAYPIELGATNLERLVLSGRGYGVPVRLTAADVLSITEGSEFNRASLGLDRAGIGGVLFVDAEPGAATLDLAGWTRVGDTEQRGTAYTVYETDGSLLAVSNQALSGKLATLRYVLDRSTGATLPGNELFGNIPASAVWSVLDAAGQPVTAVEVDQSARRLRVDPALIGADGLKLRLVAEWDGKQGAVRDVELTRSDLSFRHVATPGALSKLAVADINKDGLLDVLGSYQRPDGSFAALTGRTGLEILFADGRAHRDNRLADFDNDGNLDLIATPYAYSCPGPDISFLMRGNGDGTFTNIQSFADLQVQGFSETIIVADFDNDGLTDFYIPFYFTDDGLPNGCCSRCLEIFNRNQWVGEPRPVKASRFFVNKGDLEFEDATKAWDITNSDLDLSFRGTGPGYGQPEGAQALDLNLDGKIDFYVQSRLLMNQGGSFYDANSDLGLPIIDDEGTAFFDWNNDGALDLLILSPNRGLFLYQFNVESGLFEHADVFNDELVYRSTYGLAVGDINGDGWEDVYIGPSYHPDYDTGRGPVRLFLNDRGLRFTEFKSDLVDAQPNDAGIVIEDMNGDGRLDLVLGGTRGILMNASDTPVYNVTVTLLGPDGQMNQHGRVVRLTPVSDPDGIIYTRIVDSGSGFMAQRDYAIRFTDPQLRTYQAEAYLVDYPTGQSVRILFSAEGGRAYKVFAGDGMRAAHVIDVQSGEQVASVRDYMQTADADSLRLTAPGAVRVTSHAGDDRVELASAGAGSWGGSRLDGGAGNDVLVWDGSYDLGPSGLRPLHVPGDSVRASVDVRNFEVLDLAASGVRGLEFAITPDDVGRITEGSDLDRAALPGLGLTGRGGVLLVAPGDNRMKLGEDWREVGLTRFQEQDYRAFAGGGQLLLLQTIAPVAQATTSFSSREDEPVSIVVPTTIFAHADPEKLDYRALLGDGQPLPAWLTFDPVTRSLQGTPPPDWNGRLTLRIVASDGLSSGHTQLVLIIDPVNDAPRAASGVATLTGLEDTPVLLNLPADLLVDPDGDALTWTAGLESGAPLPAWLTFDDKALRFTGTPPQDWHGTVRLQVTASDGQSVTKARVDLVIGPVNDDPVISPVARGSISEHSAVGTVALRVKAVDIDGGSLRLALSGADAASFTIDQDGSIRVRNPADLDFEKQSRRTFVVEASNGAGATARREVQIDLTDAPERLVAANGGSATALTDENWTLIGGSGSETLTGRGGNDHLNGGPGDDLMVGGGGDDLYVVDSSADRVVEAARGGNDSIFTSASYTLAAGQEIELLSTKEHRSTASIDLKGNELAQTIYGNFGANKLDGGRGAPNILIGLAGDDVYSVWNPGDQVIEAVGGGSDTVFARETWTLARGSEVEILSTVYHRGTDAINLTGNEHAQTIYGNFGANQLDGGAGQPNTLIGLAGDDVYSIWNSGDRVVEAVGGGFDKVYARTSHALAADAEVEILSSFYHRGTDAINLTGNGFGQTIYGNFGDNVLNGGGGADTLIGFAGKDRFAFTTKPDKNLVKILDFKPGEDQIALDRTIFDALRPGSLDAKALASGKETTTADHRILYDSGTGILSYDADGAGGRDAIRIAELTPGLTLTAADFFVIA